MCSRNVSVVAKPTLSHNAPESKKSCPQWSGEALELPQSWLEALLPSYRRINEEIATSGHNKYREGIPATTRDPAICTKTIYPSWPSQELCAILAKRVRYHLSFLLQSPSGNWLWQRYFVLCSNDSTRKDRRDEKKLSIPSTSSTTAIGRGAPSIKLLVGSDTPHLWTPPQQPLSPHNSWRTGRKKRVQGVH